jgi:hypothetical protein
MQVVSIGQATELSCVPDGIDERGVQSVKSTVLKEIPPPPSATPTVTQVVGSAHEMDVKYDTNG